ncbi:hypothetical protein ABZT47_08125 [Sphaerisporangium sp. NPDC005289]|uniref:hypothetical protein n=1 Tax=Sphaerisporangium sp. NPDC005289 TaxID=3155247 RepID=UPI0033B6DA6B
MHDLAKLSAPERQRIVDGFVDQAFAGIAPDAPGAGIGQAMRRLPDELPDAPAEELGEAWSELVGLLSDEAFQRRVRQMVLAGVESGGQAEPYDAQTVIEHAGAAVAAGVAPESPEGRQVLDRIVAPETPAAERAALADRLETFTDRRVERYWELMSVLNGRPPYPSGVPSFEWVIAALRAHA